MSPESVHGGPTPEEVAVVTAAYLALQGEVQSAEVVDTTPVWRFSGRWFQR